MAEMLIFLAFFPFSFQSLQPLCEHRGEAGTEAEQTSIQIRVLFASFCII